MALRLTVNVSTTGAEQAGEEIRGIGRAAEQADRELEQMQQGFRRANPHLVGGAREARESVAGMGTAAASATATFTGMSGSIMDLYAGVQLAIGAFRVLGDVFSSTLGASMELEKGLAEINTLLNDSGASTNNLNDDILQLQSSFGTDASTAARATYNAISSGAVDASNSIGLLMTANKLAVGGVTDLDTSVDGLTTVLNGFRNQNVTATQTADVFFAAMKRGKTTVGALAADIGKAVAPASLLGVTMEETFAAVSTATGVLPSTAEAVTAVKSAMVGLLKPTAEMTTALNQIGFESGQAAVKQLGFVGTLQALKGIVGDNAEEMVKLLGRQEALAGMAATTGDNYATFSDILQEVERSAASAGAVTEEAVGKMAAASSFSVGRVGGQIKTLQIMIGQVLESGFDPLVTVTMHFLQLIIDMANGVRTAARSISDFLGPFADFVGWFVKIVTVVAAFNIAFAITKTLLLSTAIGVGTLNGALGILSKVAGLTNIQLTATNINLTRLNIISRAAAANGLAALKAGFLGAAKASLAFTASILKNPLFWKAAAIIAVIASIITAIKQIEEETQAFSTLFNELGEIFGFVGDKAKGTGENFAFLSTALATITKAFVLFGMAVVQGIQAIVTAIVMLIGKIAQLASALPGLGEYAEALQGTMQETEDALTRSMEKTSQVMGRAWDSLTGQATAATEAQKEVAAETAVAAAAAKAHGAALQTLKESLIAAEVAGKSFVAMQISMRMASEQLAVESTTADERVKLQEQLYKMNLQYTQGLKDIAKEARKATDALRAEDLAQMKTLESLRKSAAIKLAQDVEPIKIQLAELTELPQTGEVVAAARALQAQLQQTIVSGERELNDALADLAKERQSLREKEIEEQKKYAEESGAARMMLLEIYGDDAGVMAESNQRALAELQDYRDRGLITERDYYAARKQLLENFAGNALQNVLDNEETEVQAVARKYTKRRELLEGFHEQGIISDTQYWDTRSQLADQYFDKLAAAQAAAKQAQLSQQLGVAEQTGDTAGVFEIRASQQLLDVAKQLRQGLISPQQASMLSANANTYRDAANVFAFQQPEWMGAANAFLGGALEGLMGAANMILAVPQAMLAILDAVGNMLEFVVTLPQKLMDGFIRIGDMFERLLTEFLPSLVKMLPTIFEQLYVRIPKLALDFAMAFIQAIPMIVMEFVNAIPGMVGEYAETLATKIPQLAVVFMKQLIIGAPMIAVQLAIGIVKAIVEVFKGLFKGFKNLGKDFATGMPTQLGQVQNNAMSDAQKKEQQDKVQAQKEYLKATGKERELQSLQDWETIQGYKDMHKEGKITAEQLQEMEAGVRSKRLEAWEEEAQKRKDQQAKEAQDQQKAAQNAAKTYADVMGDDRAKGALADKERISELRNLADGGLISAEQLTKAEEAVRVQREAAIKDEGKQLEEARRKAIMDAANAAGDKAGVARLEASAELRDMQALLEKGLITQDQFDVASKGIDKALTKRIKEIQDNAAKNQEDLDSSTLEAAETTQKLVADGAAEGVARGLKDATKEISDVGENMFGVREFTDSMQAVGDDQLDAADEISNRFDESTVDMADQWDQNMESFDTSFDTAMADWDQNLEGLGDTFDTGLEGWDDFLDRFNTSFGDFLDGLEFDLGWFQDIVDALKWVWDFVILHLQLLWDTLVAQWELMWGLATVAWDLMVAVFQGVWDASMAYLELLWEELKVIWYFVRDMLMTAWDSLKAVWEFVEALFEGVIDLFKATFQFIMELFQDPIGAFKNLFENVKRIFLNIIDKFLNVFNTIFTGIKNAFDNAITSLKNAFTEIWNKFTTIGAKIWDSFTSAFDKAGQFFKDFGSKIWDAVTSAFSGLKDLFFPASAWGKGTVESFLGIDIPYMSFAQGGTVPGRAPRAGNNLANDVVPALLSPGEFVIDRVAMAGGADAIWQRLAGAGLLPQYGFGGFVKGIAGSVSKAVAGTGDFVAGVMDDPFGTIGDIVNSGIDMTGLGDTWVGELIKGAIGIPLDLLQMGTKLIRAGGNIDWGNLVSNPLDEIGSVFKSVLFDGLLKDPLMNIVKGMLHGFSEGGLVPGNGSGDTFPAMLAPGELVVPKARVKTFDEIMGKPTAEKRAQKTEVRQDIKQEFNIDVTINADKIDDKMIKGRIVPAIKEALRKESKVGRRLIIDPKGVRT